MRHPDFSLLALALISITSAHAQTGAAPTPDPATATAATAVKKESLQRVEVKGAASDDASRRASTAAKIVIGRDEIERFGDSSLGEVLKRLPGVTTGGRPGRGGDIRMRGMGGGYTQILVNGERMSPGFSLDQLAPDQVERIEILRAPSAEYGARAIAGTINVVLREALQKRMNDLRFALSAERDQLRPNIGWTRNDKLDDHGGAYNLSVNAMQNERRDDVNSSAVTHSLTTPVPDSTLRTLGENSATNRNVNIAARLQWKLGADSLSVQPFFVASNGHSDNQFTQTITPPLPLTPLPGQPRPPGSNFDQALSHSSSRNEMLRINSQWQQSLGEDSKLEVRGGVGRAEASSRSFRRELRGAVENRNQDDTVDSRDNSWSLNTKLSRQLKNEHSLVGGIEGEGTTRNQNRVSLQNGLVRPELGDFGDNLVAATKRFAAYAQDEWSVGKQWAFYAGLRGETIATRSRAANYAVSNRSTVWTPLLHGVWKFDEKSRDQIRASLTRSYRSPNLNDLIARPSINSQYPCLPDLPCGANEANYPDRIGNPGLKPELASGVDIAYENFFSKGGVLSANVFYRRISNLMRNVTGLETVAWSDVQRWVSRPRNIGNATTMGLELEAKFRLDEFIADALPVNVRSNLSLFSSRVDGIPGPNNTLDQQPKGTANLGADYRLRSLPLSLGASLNYTPATTIRQTLLQQSRTSRKVVSDAFALWVVNPTTQLRVSATNLTPLDYATGSVITTPDKMITSESGGRTFTLWQVRLEIKV